MKIIFGGDGAWIQRDERNDVHVYHNRNQKSIEIAINDETVYKGVGACPLALSLSDGNALVQIVGPDGPKFYEAKPELVDSLLREFLQKLAEKVV